MCDLYNAKTAKNFYKGGTSGRDVPEFTTMPDKRIWIHGDPFQCKLCQSCCPICTVCCDFCVKCKTCDPKCCDQCPASCLKCKASCDPLCLKCKPLCLKCKTCELDCCMELPCCKPCCENPSCLKCKASCLKCKTCDCCMELPCCEKPSCLKCKTSCLKCKTCDLPCCSPCKPSCLKCLTCAFCDCGPVIHCRPVGCELCPGPLSKFCGDWHMATDRCPDKCPAFLFPMLVNPDCYCKPPCCGGKEETFINGDFVDPGKANQPKTLTIKLCAACCPAPKLPPQVLEMCGGPKAPASSDKKAAVEVAPKDADMK